MVKPPQAGAIPIDFGLASADYATHRQGFPPTFFDELDRLGLARPGDRALDVGTGTGLLARALARRGCRVTGLDPSQAMLDQARLADAAADVAIDYRLARAEATGLPSASYDLVAAATCWHWFDRPAAAREARRLLKRAGRLLIAQLDWQRVAGNVIDLTIETINRFAEDDSQPGATSFQHPDWASELTGAGFAHHRIFGFTTPLTYTREAWRGRVRASARVGPSMDAATLAAFDRAFDEALRDAFPKEPLSVDHRIFAVVAWGA